MFMLMLLNAFIAFKETFISLKKNKKLNIDVTFCNYGLGEENLTY